jgi:hypothetical protein
MPDDGAGRFGYTHAFPYAFYFADLAWLPWLEINARLTTFENVYVTETNDVNSDGRGRHYMDKAIDVKALLHRSRRRYVPSLAFGVTDMMGTELMKAWYGVATWHFDRWAFSVGYGTDRMNGLFGGVSWNAAEWLTLKAEYSPLDYSLDRAGRQRPHPDAAKAKYNVGAVLKASWGTEAAVSWQRNEEFAFSLSQRFDLQGDSFLGLGGVGGREAYGAPGAGRAVQWKDADPEKLGRDLMEALSVHVRVRDVEVGISERKIFVAYENYGHASDAEAMVRVLVVTAALSPHLESIFLVPHLRGVSAVCAEFPGEVLFGIRARDMDTKNLLQAARFTWAEKDFFEAREGTEKWLFRERGLQNRARHDLRAMVVYEPRIDQTLEDDYQSRWSVDFVYENRSTNGWGVFADVRVPFFNDADIWWEPDMTDEVRLQQAMVGYLANLGNPNSGNSGNGKKEAGIWVLGEAGWLDENWFGLNLWGRAYTRDGRWWGGTRLGAARDRDPRSFAGLAEGEIVFGGGGYADFDKDPWRSVAWLQGGYSLPGTGLDLQVDYGRFADTDVGAKLSATRRWDAAAVGFWISRTDRLSPGKDFTSVGVHLELPTERWFGSWLGRASSHIWDQDVPLLSTWRIDAGREPGSRWSPERTLSRLRPMELKRNVEKLLREYCSFEPSSDF